VKEVPRPSVFASYLIRFKVDKSKVNPLYISYVLKSTLFTDYVNGANSSGVQPNINAKTLSAFEFPLPDRPTQDRVAELLNDFESAAFNNRRIGKLLSKTMDALFLKMCTNLPLTNIELRATGITIESGSRPKGGVAGISEGVPSIGAESIAGIGVYDYSKTKYVPEEFFNQMRKGIPQDFDVLLYKDGGKPGEFKPRLGMFGLGFPFSDYAINEHVFLLRSEQLGQPFLYFWLNQEKVLDVLRNAGIKAAIPGINQQDVNRLIVEVPKVEVIDAFNEKAMPVVEEILRLAGESRVLLQLRDSYLKRFIVECVSPPAEMLAS
jgi:type I restriction enzyme S subunit